MAKVTCQHFTFCAVVLGLWRELAYWCLSCTPLRRPVCKVEPQPPAAPQLIDIGQPTVAPSSATPSPK